MNIIIFCIVSLASAIPPTPNVHNHNQQPPFLVAPPQNNVPVAAAQQQQRVNQQQQEELRQQQLRQQQEQARQHQRQQQEQARQQQLRQQQQQEQVRQQQQQEQVRQQQQQEQERQQQQQEQERQQQQQGQERQQQQQQENRQQQQRQHQQQGAQVSGSQPLLISPNPLQSSNAIPNIIRPGAQESSSQDFSGFALDGRKRVEDTQVQCLKTHMTVIFRFSEPFNGYIYPHKQFTKCLLFRGSNSLEATLSLKHGTCGDQENKIVYKGKSFLDPVIEHRLMVQWQRNIVSEDDSTVIVRCDRPDDFNKTVEWKFQTRELSASLQRSQHPGPKMWMEIQRGEGPSAPQLVPTDPVFIGDVLTLTFTLTDNVYWFDSNIISCHALDGGQEQAQIEWDASESRQVSERNREVIGQTTVIENGCSVKLSLFSHFKKERNTMPNGDLVTLHYVYFKAFRFPTSMKIVLQCNVQVCYRECPAIDPCSEGFHPRLAEERSRRRREAKDKDPEAHEIDRVEMMRSLEVLLKEEGGEERVSVNSPVVQNALEEYCYSPTIYYTTVISLVCAVVILIVIIAFICVRDRMHSVSFFTPTKANK